MIDAERAGGILEAHMEHLERVWNQARLLSRAALAACLACCLGTVVTATRFRFLGTEALAVGGILTMFMAQVGLRAMTQASRMQSDTQRIMNAAGHIRGCMGVLRE